MKTNMKKLKYMVAGTMMLLTTGLSFTACTDANDWDVDSSYDRPFRVTKMGITAKETEAEYTWTATPNTNYYIIEVSKDSLYEDIAMGTANGSIVFGEDKSITKSPYTLTHLDSSSKYFLRIKSFSPTGESKWAYPEGYSFKTKSEQIMEEVGSADKTSTTAILRWIPESKVTHIVLMKGDQEDRRIDLADEVAEAGTMTLEGLEPLTTYTVSIYNNEVKRGSVSFLTYPSVPEADYTAYLTVNDSLNQTLFDDIAAGGYKNVTIALAGDAQYNNAGKLALPDGMSLTFFGLPGDKKPVIAIQQFDLASSHGFIKFENVELSAYCTNEDGSTTQNSYVFNQSTATNVGSIEFSNCFIHDFKNSPVRLQGTDKKTIGNLIVDNCIIYGVDARSYSIVHVDAGAGAGKIENITFTNSTVWKSGKSFIYSKSTSLTKITIKNCTLGKVPGAGDYIIDLGDTSYSVSEGVIIENCIFGSMAGATAKGIRCGGNIDVIDSYNTTSWVASGNAIKNLTQYEGADTSLFVDPEKADFTIKDNYFEGKRSCGDPRWYMPE